MPWVYYWTLNSMNSWEVHRLRLVSRYPTCFLFCGDKSPFCGPAGVPCFGLQLTLPTGFKARGDPSSPALCSHLHVMILLRVNSEFPGLDLTQFYTLGFTPNVTSGIIGRGKIITQALSVQSPMIYRLSYPGRLYVPTSFTSPWRITWNKAEMQQNKMSNSLTLWYINYQI